MKRNLIATELRQIVDAVAFLRDKVIVALYAHFMSCYNRTY